ncbi:sterol desaturase family protein [Planctobacterium marinum]|uniref:sterol desaturase family protein n=1 Tax=Planctobacterium marinum TaxID=1631968 RepID=UPI001E55AC9E|nr:sterol desaturase family protein [Planctobacterium marinum]MCC2606747.1 sterol desaturase family protein [Planctobacterium marinum]
MLEQFKSELIELGRYLLDPNKRLFLGYIAGALIFALWVYIAQQRKVKNDKGFFYYLFNPKVWLHKSAVLDYQLFIVNRLVRAFLWAPLILTMVPIAMGLSDALEWTFGQKQLLTGIENDAIVIFVFTLVLFLFDDFTRFLLHYLLHKVPFLWEFHKVHHSALVLTPMTVYRSHPLESFLYACRMGLAQGCAVGVCYFLFGPTLSMADILGANVFIFLFNVMGSNLRHSHVKWRWGDTLEKWFISPVQHQIHHSRQVQFHDKNFGTALAIWDRLFGTLVLSGKTRFLLFGLDKKEPSHKSLLDAYARPFIACKNRLLSRKTRLPLSAKIPE